MKGGDWSWRSRYVVYKCMYMSIYVQLLDDWKKEGERGEGSCFLDTFFLSLSLSLSLSLPPSRSLSV